MRPDSRPVWVDIAEKDPRVVGWPDEGWRDPRSPVAEFCLPGLQSVQASLEEEVAAVGKVDRDARASREVVVVVAVPGAQVATVGCRGVCGEVGDRAAR